MTLWSHPTMVRNRPHVLPRRQPGYLTESETADPRSHLRTTVLFGLIFGVVYPAWVISGMSAGPRSTEIAYAAQVVLLVYITIRVATLFAAGRPDWMQITFWCFVYTWFGVAPFVQLIAGRTPLRQAVDPSVVTGQALLVFLGLISYDVGRTIATRRRRPVVTIQRVLVPRRAMLLGVLAVVLTPFLVQLSGGIEAVLSSRQARTAALVAAGYYSSTNKTTGAFISVAASVFPFVGLYCLVLLRRQKHPAVRSTTPFYLACVALLGSNLLLNNPISSSRFWVLTVLLSFVFVLGIAQTKTGVRCVILGFLLASMIVFPYLDAYRYERVNVKRQTISHFMTYKLDYDAMAQVGNAIRFVSEYGHTAGRQMLGALLFWVPRSWWPAKPIDTGSMLAQFAHYPNKNLSGPFWAELYVDFGILGMVIGFLVLGYASARLGRVYLAQLLVPARMQGAIVGALPIFAMYQVLILRGSLLQAMGRLAVLVVVWLLLTRRSEVAGGDDEN